MANHDHSHESVPEAAAVVQKADRKDCQQQPEDSERQQVVGHGTEMCPLAPEQYAEAAREIAA